MLYVTKYGDIGFTTFFGDIIFLKAIKFEKMADGKFVKPELQFCQNRVEVGGPGSGEKILVSQLVRKGSVLADFPNYPAQKKKGYLRAPMEPGANVVFDTQAHALVADVTGYPKVGVIEREDEPDFLIIEVTPLIKVSHNKMLASMVLHPVLPNAPSVKTEDIDKLITEAGIVYGIDQDAVAKIREIAAGPCDDFDEILFAQGIFPGEGVDASLRFELEIGPLAGHILPDGTIDFRDRRIMVGVKEGQYLATKIPALPGAPGYNVLGKRIESKTGKDLRVKVVGDARYIPEEHKVIASKDGAMSVINKDTIKVVSKTTIPGDIDYSTGNVESGKNVVIKGSVSPGFNVEVGGDLEVGGAVSNAEIQAGGNIVIKGGITGTSSTIGAGGDVDLKFIERGTVKSGGVVVVRKQCYYSSIEAVADIRCHRESSILGGTLLAGGNLSVGNVGAESCEPAFLGAGIDAGRYLLYQQLQKELIEQKEEIIQAIQLHGKGARPKKIRRMEETAMATKKKLLTLNLIPGTELYSRMGKGSKRDDLDDEDPMYTQGTNIEKIHVEIHGRMYAGTTILLGNRTVTLKQDVAKRRFRLSKNLKSIMALPL